MCLVYMRVCYTDSHYITNCFSHPCDTNPPFCWRECAYMSLISRLRASLRQTLRSRGEPTTLLAHCKPTDSHILVARLSRILCSGFIFSFQPLGKMLDSLDIFEGASLIPSAYTFHVFSHWPVRPHRYPSAVDPHRRPAGLLHKAKLSIISNPYT